LGGLRRLGLPPRHLCRRPRPDIQATLASMCSGRLPDETGTHLFRLAREALTNVARHAAARRVEVKLESGGGKIRLTLQDDDRGLAAAPAPEARQARAV